MGRSDRRPRQLLGSVSDVECLIDDIDSCLTFGVEPCVVLDVGEMVIIGCRLSMEASLGCRMAVAAGKTPCRSAVIGC